MTTAKAGLFEGLPRPEPGKLTLYVFGPGVGESQVIALPDGKWVVVDTCEQDGIVLPLALLAHFNVAAIDLLVVTHPDRDHYRGLPQLVKAIEVKHLWRYPGFNTRRAVLAQLCALHPDNKGYAELREAEGAMACVSKPSRRCEAALDTMPWPGGGAPYEVTCIAPCQEDQTYEGQQLHKLFRLVRDGIGLDERAERFLLGKARGIDGKGNPLSLALAIWWQGIGVLLGGDVEAPRDAPDRGWSGVLATLAEDWPKSLDLLRNLRVVKVSHHGSTGAFSEPAWKLHAEAAPVDLAIITPYRGGTNNPPQREALQALGRFVRRIALTSTPENPTARDHLEDPPAKHGSWRRLTDAGWVCIDVPRGPGAAACVAVTLDATAASELRISQQGALFARPTPATAPGPTA